MIIEIESVYGDVLLYGTFVCLSQLNKQVKDVISLVSEKDFVPVFCSRYGYKITSNHADLTADYVVDLDTHTVYRPSH